MPTVVRNAAPQTIRGSLPAADRRNPAQHISTGLLAFAAVASPLAMGCTTEWGRLGLEAAMTTAVVLWAASSRERAWAYVLPVAISALVLLQLLPLPDGILVNLAPVSAGTWKAAHDGNPAAWGTISVNPAATAAGGRRLLLGLATIVAVTSLSRSRRHRLWLTAAIALSGLVILTLGFLFPFDRDDRTLLGFIDLKGPIEFWRTPVLPPAQTSGWAYLEWVPLGDRRYLADLRVIGDGIGPYVNSNQFAGGVYLTLPAALGLLLSAGHGRGRGPTLASLAAAMLLFIAAMWVVGHIAVSRAGMASLLMAGLMLAALAAPPDWPRRLTGAAVLGYGIFILLFTLLFLGNFQALSALLPEEWRGRILAAGDDSRAIASRAAVRMFLASPLLGTGLNTYADLYPQLTRRMSVVYFAHNDYAQVLAETGLVGLVIVAALMTLIAARFRSFLGLRNSSKLLMEAGPWASLAGLLVHSLFDWNLHVPANAFLAALTTGLCLGSVPVSEERIALPTGRHWSPVAFGPRVMLVGSCIVGLALMVRDAFSDAGERNLRLATALSRSNSDGRPDRTRRSTPSLAEAISAAERAAEADPWNGGLALALGQAHLHATASGTEVTPISPAADAWFRRAQANRAVCLGIPQQVPPPPRTGSAGR